MNGMQASRDLRIDGLTPVLAEGLPDFVYKTFGYSYEDQAVYDVPRILDKVTHGKEDVLVCSDADGVIRGTVSLDFCFPTRQIAEIKKLMIDPDVDPTVSGQALKLLLQALRNRVRAHSDERGLRTVISLEVTDHQLSQRLVRDMGFTTAGLYLGEAPACQNQLKSLPPQRTVLPGENSRLPRSPESGSGRNTHVVSARPLRSRTPPQSLSVPDRFADLIREIYVDFRLQFEFAPAIKAEGETIVKSAINLGGRAATVEIRKLGADAERVALERLDHFRNGFIEAIRFLLPLSGTDTGPVVERLVEAGCGFAAVLPQFGEAPVLVLQSVDPEKLAPVERGLLSPRASRILAQLLGNPSPRPETTPPQPALGAWVIRR